MTIVTFINSISNLVFSNSDGKVIKNIGDYILFYFLIITSNTNNANSFQNGLFFFPSYKIY